VSKAWLRQAAAEFRLRDCFERADRLRKNADFGWSGASGSAINETVSQLGAAEKSGVGSIIKAAKRRNVKARHGSAGAKGGTGRVPQGKAQKLQHNLLWPCVKWPSTGFGLHRPRKNSGLGSSSGSSAAIS